MTPHDIDRVFGRGRLKMLTGPHVEVFREAAARGESRRYTKRFLTTAEGDYAQWTEREWRILARLIGHGARCVPDVVQYDRGAYGTKLVQTYDAGATVDQWATLLPVERDGAIRAHVFEDCAHWWALAHHCLVALDEIHSLELVHLDVKGDNICIPIGPREFDPAAEEQRLFPVFRKLALIDFAFSLVSGETLGTALPIGWQQDYDYQSPRLLRALEAGRAGDLQPTEDLDWRCDMYSLAAMLKRYLPDEGRLYGPGPALGWTAARHDAAKALILRIREAHDRERGSRRPHADLIAETSAQLADSELIESLERGWTLARDAQTVAAPATPLTPVTRLAPIRIVIPPRQTAVTAIAPPARDETGSPRSYAALRVAAIVVIATIGIVALDPDAAAWVRRTAQRALDGSREVAAMLRERLAPAPAPPAIAASDPTPAEETTSPPAAPVEPPPADPAPPTAADAPPSKPPVVKPRDESFASRIEAHRTKPVTRSARAAAPAPRMAAARPAKAVQRVPSPIASKVARTAPGRPQQAVVAPPAAAPVVDPIAQFAAAPMAAVAVPTPTPEAAPVVESPATPSVTAEPPRAVVRSSPVPPAAAPIVEKSRPVAPPAIAAAPPLPPVTIAEAPRAPPAPAPIDADATHLARGRQLLDDVVPGSSARINARVARVLWMAAGAWHPAQERAILALSSNIAGDPIAAETRPGEARRLHDAARQAYQLRHHIPEAFDFAVKAFGANPGDAEIAGHLAFLHLKIVPPAPERARQLALHALALRREPYPTARFDDWTTFAVASALTGRQMDARHALYATLVLARDTDRVCRSMLGALASYGERLRDPVEAMLDRLQSRGRGDESAYCNWLSGRLARF